MALLTRHLDLLDTYPRARAMLARMARVLWAYVFAVTGSPAAALAAELTTEELILSFQRGRPWVFEALYDRYKDYVYRVSFFVLGHREEAEDAVQETFLDVLRALPDYDVMGPARFETWLYRVTVNRARMRLRRGAGRQGPATGWDDMEERLERLPVAAAEPPEAAFIHQEEAQALWQAVERLPEAHRLPIMLRYREALSYEEIAQVLGLGLGTVKSRLFNAHKKLQQMLQSRPEKARG